jgi:hypothetical protein
VKVQVFTLLPPLVQAPVQTAERPLDADRVTDVPIANVADPLLPVATLMPAGLDVTRSPLRPVALTVTVAFCGGAAAGITVRTAVRVTPPYDAVIVTGVEMPTTAVVLPPDTVALAGTAATAGLLLVNETAAPVSGAAPDSTRAACAPVPPVTLDGLSTRFCRVDDGGGWLPPVTERVDDRDVPLSVAVMTTLVVLATGDVAIVNVPVKPPVGTVTLAGTLATDGLLLDSEITVESGAETLTTTVPLDASPPATVAGLTSRVVSAVGAGAA